MGCWTCQQGSGSGVQDLGKRRHFGNGQVGMNSTA